MKWQILYRPVGEKELELIKGSGYKKFPPRLEWQPIFYPVMNEEYAKEIALKWNTEDEFSGYAGHVTMFKVPASLLEKYPVQNVGGEIHNELWIPAAELEEFNNSIDEEIRVIHSFYGKKHKYYLLNKIKGALFGLSVGDALGVPVEFKTREYLESFPIKGITGYGCWNQPPGTWSDDSSLAFCLAESLTKGYELDDIASNFVKWYQHGYWGAHHKLFDVGGATRYAIERLIKGTSPTVSGGLLEEDNGNGSLMRILPLVFYIKDMPLEQRYEKIKEVSSITHGHFRSVFSCFIYMEIAIRILNGEQANDAVEGARQQVKAFAIKNEFDSSQVNLFYKVLDRDTKSIHESAIFSGGYVLQTLEASVWCLLNTDNYKDAVLKAVNLGGDTDTTACVTGGLAGLLYGYNSIPQEWIDALARKDDIEDLCQRLFKRIIQ